MSKNAFKSRNSALLMARARAGIADAQDKVGQMYLYGVGAEADREEALSWFRRASDGGSPFGMRHLANLLLADDSQYHEALALFERASSLGDAESMYRLSLQLLRSQKAEDRKRAVFWLRQSANLGHEAALQVLDRVAAAAADSAPADELSIPDRVDRAPLWETSLVVRTPDACDALVASHTAEADSLRVDIAEGNVSPDGCAFLPWLRVTITGPQEGTSTTRCTREDLAAALRQYADATGVPLPGLHVVSAPADAGMLQIHYRDSYVARVFLPHATLDEDPASLANLGIDPSRRSIYFGTPLITLSDAEAEAAVNDGLAVRNTVETALMIAMEYAARHSYKLMPFELAARWLAEQAKTAPAEHDNKSVARSVFALRSIRHAGVRLTPALADAIRELEAEGGTVQRIVNKARLAEPIRTTLPGNTTKYFYYQLNSETERRLVEHTRMTRTGVPYLQFPEAELSAFDECLRERLGPEAQAEIRRRFPGLLPAVVTSTDLGRMALQALMPETLYVPVLSIDELLEELQSRIIGQLGLFAEAAA